MYHCIHRMSSLIQTRILYSVQVIRTYKPEQKYFNFFFFFERLKRTPRDSGIKGT